MMVITVIMITPTAAPYVKDDARRTAYGRVRGGEGRRDTGHPTSRECDGHEVGKKWLVLVPCTRIIGILEPRPPRPPSLFLFNHPCLLLCGASRKL